jgi:pimeloyl-ACP methyl ester carboxylesterase
MKKTILIGAAATVLALAAALLVLVLHRGRSWSDPATARCNAPQATFGAMHVLADHREVDVNYTCSGAVIASTLTLPKGRGPHPAVVFVHASGEHTRYTWPSPFIRALVRSGVAVLSYDKRGVGESQGVCCPGDDDHFNLLAADVDGAVSALRRSPDIDRGRIGLLGVSQAGWIVPLAVARSRHRVAFTVLVSGPTVTTGAEHLYSRLAGEDEPGRLSKQRRQEISQRLLEAGPSGFDPAPFLRQMTTPGLWLYGGEDKSQPSKESAAVLRNLQKAEGKDFTVVVFPDAGHGLLDVPPTDPRALPTLVRWIRGRVHLTGSRRG